MSLALNICVEEETVPLPERAMSLLRGRDRATPPQQLDLSLSINFSGEEEIDVPGGRARFGITQGELEITLDCCQLPIEGIREIGKFEISREGERKVKRASDVTGGLAPDKATLAAKRSEEVVETSDFDKFQLQYVGGKDNAPAWCFTAFGDKDREVLERGLKNFLLGTVDVESIPCKAKATFKVRGEDIRLTWGSFAGTKDISRRQTAFIERFIVLQYLRSLIESAPVSEWEVSYE